VIILGIDPGYAIVGFGVIEKTLNSCRILDYGAITTPKIMSFPHRLKRIRTGMMQLIDKYQPEVVAVEELFFTKNVKTGIAVAEARGVILECAVSQVKRLYEYTPNQIKQALTGTGKAEKKQVQYMVKAILNLKEIPKPDDAADAVAVALCHAQTNQALDDFGIK